MSYLFGLPDVALVTDASGRFSLAPGVPIVDLPSDQALAATLVSDADQVFAPLIVGYLAPSLVADSDALYGPTVAAGAITLAPSLLGSDDAFPTPAIAVVTHGLQHLRPDVALDPDTIYPAALGRGVYPALVPADDVIYAVPSITAAKGAQLVVDPDVIFGSGVTLFLVPSRVADPDSIPAADVGWKIFAATTTDADQIYSPHADAYAGIYPDILVEDDDLRTYPFYVHGVSGGIPVPERPHLSGSLKPPLKVLSGSLKKPIHLTGSLKHNRRVLTGSVRGANYGKGAGKKR